MTKYNLTIQGALKDYRTRQKRMKASIWIEAFSTGLITGAVIMSIIAYWIIK